MQILEKQTDGLSHTYEVIIPAKTLADRLEKKIEELRPKISLKGFRPGKVPQHHIHRLYGNSIMEDIIKDVISETSKTAFEERKLRLASQPHINLKNDIKNIIKDKSDLSYTMEVDIMPEFQVMNPKEIKVERYVSKIDEKTVLESIEELSRQNKTYQKTEKNIKAKTGNALIIDFLGKVDGAAFEGGKAENTQLVLGEGKFIPGFEEQLIDVKAGDKKTIQITFPENYPAKHLAKKEAEFDIYVKEIQVEVENKIDDAFASRLGVKDLNQLKEAIQKQIESEYAQQTKLKLKRKILDQLDHLHQFEVPHRMVNTEFEQIWKQLDQAKKSGKIDQEDKIKPEEELKDEYWKIAERRVKLGLVLSELGNSADIKVLDNELAHAVQNEARQYPGKEKEIFEFYQKNPNALNYLKAPVYEEKVINYIIELADIKDKQVDREILFEEDEIEEGGNQSISKEAEKKTVSKKTKDKKTTAKASSSAKASSFAKGKKPVITKSAEAKKAKSRSIAQKNKKETPDK